MGTASGDASCRREGGPVHQEVDPVSRAAVVHAVFAPVVDFDDVAACDVASFAIDLEDDAGVRHDRGVSSVRPDRRTCGRAVTVSGDRRSCSEPHQRDQNRKAGSVSCGERAKYGFENRRELELIEQGIDGLVLHEHDRLEVFGQMSVGTLCPPSLVGDRARDLLEIIDGDVSHIDEVSVELPVVFR